MLNFGILSQSFRMSMQNIKSNKMRSFLTMLGIIIGVAAVIGLITIVQSVSNYVMNEFSSLGAGTVSVSAFGNAMKQGLNDNDIQTLNGIEGVAGVSPTVSLTGTAVFETETFDKVNIDGKAAVYFQRNPDLVEAGRPLTVSDMSGDTNVCIVDHTFIERVMLGHEIIGNTIRLNGMEYTIVGIQGKSNNLQGAFMDTSDSDGTVLIPYHNALRLTGKANVNSLEVYIEDGVESAEVEKRLRSALNNIYNNADNSFSVFNFESLMTAMSTIEGMMSTMLGGIASIALLVGGIGIMNMMLVSVSERTKEIGLRKALGAEPFRIQAQFLIESIVLSVFGGIIGILFGELIAFVAAKLLDTTFTVSVSAVSLGFFFSLAVGVIFGWMPAKRASELNPIDALRSE